MASFDLPFGPGALWVVGGYLFSLLGIGAWAYHRRRDDSLGDFYLGGREMGVGVLFLTLYATQYSGQTLFGFSGAAYRQGLGFLVCVHFMTAIVMAYLLIAPRLYRLSRERGAITPGDFIEHRFGSPALRAVVAVIMIYVLCNYTLAQMKILGTALEGISQGRVPLWVGVTGLALVMLIYESMGGMRSVAWTDVIQGTILILGFFILMGLAFSHLGGLPEAVDTLARNPATRFKVEPPEGDAVRTWLSFLIMVGLGGALYPQALQRVYAARNVRVLKRSLVLMGFMPLLTGLVAVAVGVLMAAHRPGLDRPPGGSSTVVPSETALARLCLEVMQTSDLGYWLVVILFAAILAAVMSTADSALLSISSMVTRDLYGRFIRPQAAEADLCRAGRWVTFLLMAPIVWIALNYHGTIIQLIKIKFDVMIQCVPAFYLGIHVPRLRAGPVLAGLALGVTVALGLILTGHPTVWGFHSGVWGLVGNLALCGVLQIRGKTVPGGRD